MKWDHDRVRYFGQMLNEAMPIIRSKRAAILYCNGDVAAIVFDEGGAEALGRLLNRLEGEDVPETPAQAFERLIERIERDAPEAPTRVEELDGEFEHLIERIESDD
jgi:hypothetical protein